LGISFHCSPYNIYTIEKAQKKAFLQFVVQKRRRRFVKKELLVEYNASNYNTAVL
jgi:hypothetical protein